MEYNHLDPETWKLKCNSCDNFVQYEKLSGYHNAKSRSIRDRPICCAECKVARLKISKNPEDWVVSCTTCDAPIKYDNIASYRTIFGRIKRGCTHECESCNLITRKNVVRKDREYSRDPKDWVVDCGNPNCSRQITYTALKSYQGSMSRRKKGDPPLCFSCVSNKLDKTTKEWGDKSRGRVQSTESKEKARQTLANMSIEKKMSRSKKNSDNMTRYWANLTPEQVKEKMQRLTGGFDRLSDERKQEIFEANRLRMVDLMLNSTTGFSALYNKNTIKYIVDVLNPQFDTIFRHGESEVGEFRIYDRELKTVYFADAYCSRLNLWIEFDETNKFSYGKLRQDHIIRHNRIQEILNCPIIRIRYKKCKFHETFDEYYNDLMYWGNLNEHIKHYARNSASYDLITKDQ